MTPTDRFVFVHIPKVGGVSLRAVIAGLVGDDWISPPFDAAYLDDTTAADAQRFRVVSGHLSRNDVDAYFPNRLAFTVLRDPVERVLSWYRYLRTLPSELPLAEVRGANTGAEAIALAHATPLEEFVFLDHPAILQNLDNRYVWQLGDHAHLGRRRRSRREAFERAAAWLDQLAFVGTLERLDGQLARLAELLGGAPPSRLPTLNASTDTTSLDQLGAAGRARVGELTHDDQRLYDLAVERFR